MNQIYFILDIIILSGSRISAKGGGGANPRVWDKTPLFDKIFAENCLKMKEIGPRGGVHPWRPLPLDPPMSYMVAPSNAVFTCLFTDAPVLSFGAYNPLSVIENEAVTLTCHIDAFPPVTNSNVRWEKNGVFQGKTLWRHLSCSRC